MSDAFFETLTSKRKKTGRFDVVEDLVQVDPGYRHLFVYTSIPEGACVLPMLGDRILLLREYRYPVRSWQYSIPGGLIDPGESPSEAAVRELREETGYDVEELIPLGAIYSSFGSSDEKIHLFMARCGNKGEAEREPGEKIAMQLVTEREFAGMIDDGRYMHSAGIAAWGKYLNRKYYMENNRN